MNRKIKFKAARYTDGVLEKIYDATAIDCDEDFGVYNARLKNGEWVLNIIPLQYTGLEDKNGTEIYEGDILKFNDGHDDFYDVVWWSAAEAKYMRSDFGDIELWENIEHCEKVGNVHENKELLEIGVDVDDQV